MGEDVVLSNEEDVLVLTEKSAKQLVKDRRAHNGMLQLKAEMAQSMAQLNERRKLASKWNEREENAYNEKMKELREESDKAAFAAVEEPGKFSNA